MYGKRFYDQSPLQIFARKLIRGLAVAILFATSLLIVWSLSTVQV